MTKNCVLILLLFLSTSVCLAGGKTELGQVIWLHKVTTIKSLLIKGVNPNEEDGNDTPLFIASYLEEPDVIGLLLQYKADPNIKCKNGLYPLTVARNFAVTQLLLNNGADVNAIGLDSSTALRDAVALGQFDRALLLLRNGASKTINVRSSNGDSAFTLACVRNDLKMQALLLRYGASPKMDLFGYVKAGKYDEVKALVLKGGVDVNLADVDGHTPLMLAALNNRAEIAELLIQHGANVNATSRSQYSPLIDACFGGCTECAKILIQHGADINFVMHASDGNDYTPYKCAWYYPDLEALLKKAGAKD